MPYIKHDDRDNVEGTYPKNAGQLNYVLTLMLHKYINYSGKNYQTLNEVIGVLECAKQELYRQIVAPYEDEKKAANGSVSELDG